MKPRPASPAMGIVAYAAERSRLLQSLDSCHQASAALTATTAGLGHFPDAQGRELALAALGAVARLEARLRLLEDAYRIAAEHEEDGRQLAASEGRGPLIGAGSATSAG